MQTLAEGVTRLLEVVEIYRMNGETDYLLKIVTKEILPIAIASIAN